MLTKKLKAIRKSSYVFLTLLSTVCPSATNADGALIDRERPIDYPVNGGMISVPRQKKNIVDELEPIPELLFDRFKKREDPILKDLNSQAIGKDLITSQESKEYTPKLGVMDLYFDPRSDSRDALSKSTERSYLGKDPHSVAYFAQSSEAGKDHANHVSSIIHNRAPNAVLRVIDIYNEPSLKCLSTIDACLIAGIDAAIKSKVDFLNISLRVSPGNNLFSKNNAISTELELAFYRARDAGIGIIKSAGNDSEVTGFTAYTASLARIVENMQGSMILVGATGYDRNGRECLASFSNQAGIAHHYTVSAPGTDICAYGAGNREIVMSGTSMAAPAVTATAGLLKEAYPDLSAKDILEAIRQSARKVSHDQQTYFAKDKYGCGILDLHAALIKAEEIYKLKHL